MNNPDPAAVRAAVGRALASLPRLNTPDARATLAAWRKGANGPLANNPALHLTIAGYLTADQRNTDGTPTANENALATTLALYALLQQGNHLSSVDRPGVTLGRALRNLSQTRARRDGTSPVDERVRALILAQTWTSVTTQLRSLIQLLRATDDRTLHAIDFKALSEDLAEFQDRSRVRAVRLRWSQQFATTKH